MSSYSRALEYERSASIWDQFAAFCLDLVPICSVPPRFGAHLLRSASIWCQIAPSCLDLGSIPCVLHRFGVNLLRSASILDQFATFCLDLGPNCCVLRCFDLGLICCLCLSRRTGFSRTAFTRPHPFTLTLPWVGDVLSPPGCFRRRLCLFGL